MRVEHVRVDIDSLGSNTRSSLLSVARLISKEMVCNYLYGTLCALWSAYVLLSWLVGLFTCSPIVIQLGVYLLVVYPATIMAEELLHTATALRMGKDCVDHINVVRIMTKNNRRLAFMKGSIGLNPRAMDNYSLCIILLNGPFLTIALLLLAFGLVLLTAWVLRIEFDPGRYLPLALLSLFAPTMSLLPINIIGRTDVASVRRIVRRDALRTSYVLKLLFLWNVRDFAERHLSLIQLKRYAVFLVTIIVACMLDLVIKLLVVTRQVELSIWGFVHVRAVINSGFLGGIGAGLDHTSRVLLNLASIGVLIFGYGFMRVTYGRHRVLDCFLVFVLAGSIGALVERAYAGHVTDWIRIADVTMWFNLSDLYLITGAILYLTYYGVVSMRNKVRS